MAATREDLPEDIEALRAALLAERARAARVEAELAVARAKASDDTALIAHQRLQIEKLTRQLYGRTPNARYACSTRWNWRSRNSRVQRARTRSPPSVLQPRRRTWWRSPESARRASLSPRICRARGCSSRARPPACAAAARGCASWARTSPRRWR